MIELVYAFYSVGAFEYGKTDIKEIAAYFEQVFDIELGDYYRTFLELRLRKSSQARFLKLLLNRLEEKMNRAEDR